MTRISTFEELGIWQLAREINNDICQLFLNTALGKDYPLRNQMDKAAGSIMDNIAEGFERDGNKEFVYFLSISKASCGELRSQLFRALDREYVNQRSFDTLFEKLTMESRKISALMSYLIKSEYKGSKFNRN